MIPGNRTGLLRIDPKRRSVLLCCAWLGSVVLLGSLLWFFTGHLRTGVLVRAVNRVVARSGETRRLHLPAGRAAGLGTWFTLMEIPQGEPVSGSALVFTLMNGTHSVSCAAFVDSAGNTEKIVPLSDYAALVLEDIPEALYAVYLDRIQAAVRFSGPAVQERP